MYLLQVGKHVITIKGYLNGKESQGVDIKVDLGGSGETRQQQKQFSTDNKGRKQQLRHQYRQHRHQPQLRL